MNRGVEPRTAARPTGLHYSARQMTRVGCITIACVDPAGQGEGVLPRPEAPHLASLYTPDDADGGEDAELGRQPLQASRLPPSVMRAVGASGLRVEDMLVFLRSQMAETLDILLPNWMEHPTLPAVGPTLCTFPVPVPPFRPSAEVMRLRGTLGSAPASMTLRAHLIDRAPAIRLDDAGPTTTMTIDGVGEAEAVSSGHSLHAYVNEAWVTTHHVPIERGPVAKALLRADNDVPDAAASMYRVVGSVRLAVRLPQPVTLRLGATPQSTIITLLVFRPVGATCVDMILPGLRGVGRAAPPRTSGSVQAFPDRPSPRRPVSDRLGTHPGGAAGSEAGPGTYTQPLRTLSLGSGPVAPGEGVDPCLGYDGPGDSCSWTAAPGSYEPAVNTVLKPCFNVCVPAPRLYLERTPLPTGCVPSPPVQEEDWTLLKTPGHGTADKATSAPCIGHRVQQDTPLL